MSTRSHLAGTVTLPTSTVEIGAPERHLDTLATQQSYARVWFEDEAPQHTVIVAAFTIDAHPVTTPQRFARLLLTRPENLRDKDTALLRELT
ncbi:hypothetical protein ABZS54_41385, partial [Embleya sp. NPDC005575]